jgi:RNA polymerase sigma-70 factor (ECF subfamily)
MTEDDSLMVRIQEGDARAFEQLVERYQGQLIGFFFRNTRDAQLSEDLSQETLLRVYNQSWDYLPVGRFRGWMYRIGRNLLVDNIRRQSHDALIRAVTGARNDEGDALARLAGEVLSPEDVANEKELARLVDRLLEDLPDEQRLTFVLHHYAGLSLSEVADAMDTSVATSKSRLRLAREKLRDQLLQRGVVEENAVGTEP